MAMRLVYCIVFVLVSAERMKADKIREEENRIIESTFENLQSGEENMRLAGLEAAVLVLGSQGSGKTTLTRFVTGNDDPLVSVEINRRTSEYAIVDQRDSSNISKTLYPWLVLDSQTGAAFYDCPGFSNNRTPSEDISTAYFVDKLLRSAKKLKLIFVVDYSSIRINGDFTLFLKHASNVVKNVEKYKNSIALIVSKVDNTFKKVTRWKLQMVPDENITQSIANYLRVMKNDETVLSLNSQSENKNILDLIDIFSHNNQQVYSKLAIFRKPNEPGPINQIDLLQMGKINIKTVIHNLTKFTTTDVNDFGHDVSPNSKRYIHGLGELINSNVRSVLVSICKDIEEHFNVSENLSHDVFGISENYRLGYIKLSNYQSIDILSLTTLIEEISRDADELEIRLSIGSKDKLLRLNEQLTFLKKVDRQVKEEPSKWLEGLKDTTQFLNDGYRWFSFLISLHNALSHYNLRYNTNDNNLTSVAVAVISEHKVRAVCRQLNQLMNKIKTALPEVDLYTSFVASLKSKCPSASQARIKALKEVLNFDLVHEIEPVNESSNELLIKGRYVKLSEVVKKYWKEGHKSIAIFATTKIFIDVDLRRIDNSQELSMIAPMWEIIGNREIVLDGSGIETSGHFLGLTGLVTGETLTLSADGGTLLVDDFSSSDKIRTIKNLNMNKKPDKDLIKAEKCQSVRPDAVMNCENQQEKKRRLKAIIDKFKEFTDKILMFKFGEDHVVKFYDKLFNKDYKIID